MEPHVRQLRGPDEDAARKALGDLAGEISAHFGVSPAEAASVTDWHWGQGKWRMCWVWLLPEAEGRPCENRGIRITWDLGTCTTDAWSRARRTTMQEPSIPLPATLSLFVRMAFGIS